MQEHVLFAFWSTACEESGVRDRVGVLDGFDYLAQRYAEPHRRYHTLTHVAQILATLSLRVGRVSPELVFMAFFHDAVYDVTQTTNEADSAELAMRVLSGLCVDAVRCEAVRVGVEATKHHRASNPSAALFCDADLSVLAQGGQQYDAYVAQVREEYGMFRDEQWRKGRTGVLTTLLERPLFTTPQFVDCEGRARWNIARELALYGGHASG